MRLDVTEVLVLMARRNIRSQAELGRRSGISANAVTGLLSGQSQPSLRTIGELCVVLECEPNDILRLDREVELA